VIDKVRVPLQNPDFAAYMQRVKDARPDCLMVFIPAGKTATAVMKNFADLGLKDAGIKLIGPGDITTEEELPNMGDVALGVTTVFHWSAAGDRPANKAFIAAWKKEYGASETPNFLSVGSWDGTALIFEMIKQQKGRLDPERSMEIAKHWKFADSPRGPIAIDPETRDIIQPEYLREVKKVGGSLANVELEMISPAVKDPWKELQKKK
jgi:branched-chain amino acid transport system substrate-binding protein